MAASRQVFLTELARLVYNKFVKQKMTDVALGRKFADARIRLGQNPGRIDLAPAKFSGAVSEGML